MYMQFDHVFSKPFPVIICLSAVVVFFPARILVYTAVLGVTYGSGVLAALSGVCLGVFDIACTTSKTSSDSIQEQIGKLTS